VRRGAVCWRAERRRRTTAKRTLACATDRHVRVRGCDPTGQSVAVGTLHPAIAGPLGEAVTRRLSLRRLERDDLDELAAVFADREVWEFEFGRGMTLSETEAFLERQMKLWAECGFVGCAVRERAHPDLIGVVGLSVPMFSHELFPAVTVGWRFAPATWRRGYATEAATAVLDQAFTTMGLDRVGCATNAENRRSIAVAERLGMSVITETTVPSDDGTRMVVALLLQVGRNDWLLARNGRSERT
jgi:RimJ/RimL family protein N-acetyltransferase